MIAKPVDQITEADLAALLTSGVLERKTLDYKQQLPESNDAAKRELLADVSSFANTAGGDLIFGITESAGAPTDVPGLQIADIDQEILRIDSIIRTGLAPRVRHTTRAIRLATGRYVLVIRAERSWYGPHRVVFKGDSRFWARTTNGKYELDVTDLRNAFLFANTVTDKIAAFRAERVIALENGHPLVPLATGSLLVMHCLPLESFGGAASFDVLTLPARYPSLKPMGRRLAGWGPRINFEGIIYVAAGEPASAYTQIYRNGVIEAVAEGLLTGFVDNLIPSMLYEGTLLDYWPTCITIMTQLGCSPPVVIGISLIGVRGAKLATDVNTQMAMGPMTPINRDVLMLPDVLVEDFSVTPEVLLKPSLDLVWNACGYPSSPNFDSSGKWIGHS